MLTDGNLSGEIIREARKASFLFPAVCSPAEKQAQSTKHTCNNYSGSACCSASANYESLCGNKQIAPHSCEGRATSHSKSPIISCIRFAFQENFSATNLFVFYYYYFFFFFFLKRFLLVSQITTPTKQIFLDISSQPQGKAQGTEAALWTLIYRCLAATATGAMQEYKPGTEPPPE